MKITIYELLGLIKDGKAPKKIKYRSYIMIYEIDENDYRTLEQDYYDCDVKTYKWLTDCIDIFADLNDEIEIIEEVEDKEYEDIEEITLDDWAEITYSSNWSLLQHDFNLNSNTYTDKINALIRNQKYILEQINKEGK